jgi:hypothetical protein
MIKNLSDILKLKPTKLSEVVIDIESLRPQKGNTGIKIYGSLEFCRKFEEILNGTGTTQNTHNTRKVH